MKPGLIYLPLEPYKQRYTELLSSENGWAESAFVQKFDVTSLRPTEQSAAINIVTGSVLDSVNRPIWAMQQIIQLLRTETAGKQIYVDDMFHPGIESVPYSGINSKLYTFCWAQSFDRYDFTRDMVSWMRPYEAMAFAIFSKIFVASPVLHDLITSAFPGTDDQVVNVGLPFDSKSVRKKFDPGFQPGPYDVVFSSRFDKEKQPGFFLDLVEMLPNLNFAICTGHSELRGNDYSAVARAQTLLSKKGNLTLHSGIEKPEYYSVLRASKVQFNCSLQDWVSFTLLEALTHGCIPCYPCFRDFPHVFSQVPQCMYAPGSYDDAAGALTDLTAHGVATATRDKFAEILEYHDGTLTRIANAMLNDR